MDWSVFSVAIVCASVFVAAVLRGITGFGFALAAVPLLSIVLPPVQGVTIAILLQALVGGADLLRARRDVARPTLATMSAGAIVGTPLGLIGLYLVPADAMRVIIAVIVLAALVTLVRQVRITPGPRQAMGAGVLSGLFSGLAAMPGPPAVAYLLSTATPAAQTRATLMVFFFITSLIALPGLLLQGTIGLPVLAVTAIALPILVLGTWLGERVFRALGDGHYERMAIALLAATALVAAVRGAAGLLALP